MRRTELGPLGGYEIGDDLMALVTFYSENLAVPARRKPQDTGVLLGKALFKSSGCAACHMPSFTTGTVTGQPHLSNQRIWPYSDLLLHDRAMAWPMAGLKARPTGGGAHGAAIGGVGLDGHRQRSYVPFA